MLKLSTGSFTFASPSFGSVNTTSLSESKPSEKVLGKEKESGKSGAWSRGSRVPGAVFIRSRHKPIRVFRALHQQRHAAAKLYRDGVTDEKLTDDPQRRAGGQPVPVACLQGIDLLS